MNKIKWITFLVVFGFLSVQAQETAKAPTSPWKKTAQFGINFNHSSFSNWVGGGVNTLALGVLFNAKYEYTKGKGVWTNDLQTALGANKLDGGNWQKSIDRLFFDSKYAHKFSDKWAGFTSFNFLSQFTPTYDGAVKKSTLFAPAFLTESFGLEYKPVSYFNLQFGLGSFRQTIVGDDAVRLRGTNGELLTAFGVLPEKTVFIETGFQFVAIFDKDIAKNMNLKLRLATYSSYEKLNHSDVLFNSILTAKVNKYVNVNFSLNMLYDDDQSTKIQNNQALSVGLLYNFF